MSSNKQKFIIWFKDIRLSDVSLVGGKNASLGEMFSELRSSGIKVPDGFAVTTDAYRYFIKRAGIEKKPSRDLILKAELPQDLKSEIISAYRKLAIGGNRVAVRSSATAEDLPNASFAGELDTYLNIRGEEEVLKAVKKCFASLFTDRVISYRKDKGLSHKNLAISVGIQRMVRSDLASSGVMFTIDTETGFDKSVIIESSYGFGEKVVQGRVNPDKFVVFKPTFSIISKKGASLTQSEAIKLAKYGVIIEKHFSKKYGRYTPMDIEWAKDGSLGRKSREIFILQARPETVFGQTKKNIDEEYYLEKSGRVILTGVAVGRKIASGKTRVLKSVKNISQFKKGEILVTHNTDPDWEPIMKIASGIITDKGGRTSHAAIVARELGVPCIVGTGDATTKLKNGVKVTLDSSSGDVGNVYEGLLPFKIVRQSLSKIPETKTKVMINIGSPEEASRNANLPVSGVGLGRLEFIINSSVGVHPKLLVSEGKKDFYVEKLVEGIAKIASAFYPNDVIIRFSDFKSNEYRSLRGGEKYEPKEENPMLGWRGASRYYHPDFKEAFKLECLAIKRVREKLGLTNVIPMIPFCRTPEEGEKVIKIMREAGLDRKKDKTLKIYMMCEIPSNIILADKFLDIFDGFSIGSNDLTQLVMGMDRDSHMISEIANENNPAVKALIEEVIRKCRARKKYIGICGQAPSDHPDFLKFLIKEGIDSVSLNPDAVIKTIKMIAREEKQQKRRR